MTQFMTATVSDGLRVLAAVEGDKHLVMLANKNDACTLSEHETDQVAELMAEIGISTQVCVTTSGNAVEGRS